MKSEEEKRKRKEKYIKKTRENETQCPPSSAALMIQCRERRDWTFFFSSVNQKMRRKSTKKKKLTRQNERKRKKSRWWKRKTGSETLVVTRPFGSVRRPICWWPTTSLMTPSDGLMTVMIVDTETDKKTSTVNKKISTRSKRERQAKNTRTKRCSQLSFLSCCGHLVKQAHDSIIQFVAPCFYESETISTITSQVWCFVSGFLLGFTGFWQFLKCYLAHGLITQSQVGFSFFNCLPRSSN